MTNKVILSQTQLDAMKAKIDAMEDALSFYANEENYEQKYRSPFNSEYYDSEITLEYGKKARKALGIENE